MLNDVQVKNITYVYTRLMDSEITGWSTIDDNLELLEYLDDDQLYRECEVLFAYQQNRNVTSVYDDPKAEAFVKNILDATESILELYSDTNSMHPKNRYILSYYIALCQVGQIVELLQP